jgi:SAM-dependent methyltransferase
MNVELFDLHARVEQSHWWFVSRREIVGSLLKSLLPANPRPLVVDVGCGTGANIAGLTDWCRAVGIDTSDRAIALAQERFPSVRFIRGFAPAALGPAAREADAFLLMDVLEHVEDDRGLLRALVESARPGACIVITVPADMALWSDHDVNFGHYRRYTSEGLRAVWAGLPVEPLLVSHFNARLYPLIRAARTLGRRFRVHWGREKTDLGEPPRLVNRALRSVFGGEGRRLRRVMAGEAPAYRRGVSLIAVLRCRAREATASA